MRERERERERVGSWNLIVLFCYYERKNVLILLLMKGGSITRENK
jgi:hypothetical protein